MQLGTVIMRKKRKRIVKNIIKKDWKILDLGCGDGWLVDHLKKEGYDVIGCDIKPNKYTQCDARETPYKSDWFDCVICFNVLEHVKCEEEIKRILKPRGILIAESPKYKDGIYKILLKLNLIIEGPYEHIRLVNFNELGFNILKLKTFGFGLMNLGVMRKEKAITLNKKSRRVVESAIKFNKKSRRVIKKAKSLFCMI